jgi:hypothetical protein
MRLFIVLGLIGLSSLFSSTVSAFSCTAAFQNAAGKPAATVINYIENCKIAPRGDFASNEVYSDHLESLYYFIKVTYKSLVKDKETTISSLKIVEDFLKHINRINMCNKGYNCSPIYLRIKKKNVSLANEVNTYSHNKLKRMCKFWTPKNLEDKKTMNYACKNKIKKKERKENKTCKLSGHKVVKNHNGIVDITYHYTKKGECTKEDIKRLAKNLPSKGKKDKLDYLEKSMEKACSLNNQNLCEYYSRKIKEKIDNWDFE